MPKKNYFACNGTARARTIYGRTVTLRIALIVELIVNLQEGLFHEVSFGFNGGYSSIRITCRLRVRTKRLIRNAAHRDMCIQRAKEIIE